jgi:hypothetical protein
MKLICALVALLCMGHADAFLNIVLHPKPPAADSRMLGCFVDKGTDRAISGEGIIMNPAEVVKKCYDRAKAMGASIFGVQADKWCFTSKDAHETYDKWGKNAWPLACANGRGGAWTNDIYEIIYPAVKPTGLDVEKISGGGWKLVRHVPKGNKWYKAKDQLVGTEVYGKPCGPLCDNEWSKKFDDKKFDQFLFISGDQKKWLIADKRDVLSWYHDDAKPIYKSSDNQNEYATTAKWYRRKTNPEDPWISLTDHHLAKNFDQILYGEAGWSDKAATLLLDKHWGANVYIRKFKLSCRVQFYQHWKFTGILDVYSSNTPKVRRDNDMTSFKVQPGCCVTFYEHANYGGKSQKFCEKEIELLGGDWNDKVSSIKIEKKAIEIKECPDNGHMYPGTDIGQDSTVGSWEECGRVCKANNKCKYFTYTLKSKRCSLKSAILERKANLNKISGAKGCAPAIPTSPTGLVQWKVWWQFFVRVNWVWEIKWTFAAPNFKFQILKTGQIKIGAAKFWLQLSNKVQFPSLMGWWRFRYLNFWYYFRLTFGGMEIHKFSYDAECKGVFNNAMVNYCGKGGLLKLPTGNLEFRWIMWFKRMIGSWTLWGNLKINFLTGGKCTVGGKTFDVMFSDRVELPSWFGWFRVQYLNFWYYFRVTMTGLEVHRASVGANNNCKKTMFGLINYCGRQIGTGTGSKTWFNFFKPLAVGTWKLSTVKNFWKVKFDLNGFIYLITFNNAKINLELSDMARFPSLSGWFKFKYLNFWYYLRLVGKSLTIEWFKFGLTCSKMLDNIPILSNFCSQGTGSKLHPCDNDDKNGCQHMCVKDGDKGKCKCNAGFDLQQDGKACNKQNFKLELGSIFRFQSTNFPDRMFRHRNSEIWLDTMSNDNAYIKDSSFKVVKGLNGGCPASHPYAYLTGSHCCKTAKEKVHGPSGKSCDGSAIGFDSTCCEADQHTPCPKGPGKCRNYNGGVSFESVNKPGFFIRYKNWNLFLNKDDGSATFKVEATFTAHNALDGKQGGVSFQSINHLGYYIGHGGFRLSIKKFDNSALFKKDCSWLPITNPCDKKTKGGCSQLCERGTGDKFTCKCEIGFTLEKDGKACKQDFKHLGCWKDEAARAVPQLDGSDARIQGNYQARTDSINKCFAVARERGMRIFAVQHGGWCAASKDLNGYKKYGKANNCANGKGGGLANDVYLISHPKLHPCDEDTNGGCEQMCVKGDGDKYTCVCEKGFTLLSDGKTCKKAGTVGYVVKDGYCYNKCGKKYGPCEKHCGKENLCCKKGNPGCVDELRNLTPADGSRCVGWKCKYRNSSI